MSPADNEWMDAQLRGIIESALRNDNDDSVLLTIAPKSLNWDLKRDLAPRLKQLSQKTQEKIRDIISQQPLAAAQGDHAFASRVTSLCYTVPFLMHVCLCIVSSAVAAFCFSAEQQVEAQKKAEESSSSSSDSSDSSSDEEGEEEKVAN